MSRTVSGNEFQTEGPEAAKLRDPYRANRLRGIVNWNCQWEWIQDEIFHFFNMKK